MEISSVGVLSVELQIRAVLELVFEVAVLAATAVYDVELALVGDADLPVFAKRGGYFDLLRGLGELLHVLFGRYLAVARGNGAESGFVLGDDPLRTLRADGPVISTHSILL
jgi:hypothetical protein